MGKILKLKRICAFSDTRKGFVYNFGSDISIIHGVNTSGKSSLIQTILYMFGLNDMNKYLNVIYKNNTYIRLDASIIDKGEKPLIIIRQDDQINVMYDNFPIVNFVGFSSNSSYEHTRLRDYFRNLFGYDLFLFNIDSFKEASLETLFLPYYISQSVGWVSIRKTFDGLEYYKNFKESYIDYCLGIISTSDLTEKYKIESDLSQLKLKKSVIKNYLDEKLENVIINDKSPRYLNKYVEEYSQNEKELIGYSNDFILEKNKISLLRNRLKVLKIVKNNIIELENNGFVCPVCYNKLSDTLSDFYIRRQDYHDCEEEIKKLNNQIKESKTNINSIDRKRQILSETIAKKRRCLESTHEEGITIEEWLNKETQFRLCQKIEKEYETCEQQISKCQKMLKKFKTDEEIKEARISFVNKFRNLFKTNLSELQVNISQYQEEPRFFDLYRISTLPFQGVELLKAYLAYHFAFNEIISTNKNMPRLPFMLDAIFKEDIDENNKKLILKFISKHKPKDTQLIFSIADSVNSNQLNANRIKDEYFKDAKLIHISNKARSLLDNYSEEVEKIKKETLALLCQ